jgi:predicted dinucleotide-binding enzyme
MSAPTPVNRPATYSIIGAGHNGTALARAFARAEIACSVANSRGPDSLRPLVDKLGGTIVAKSVEAALGADIVVLAIPFAAVEDFAKIPHDWSGKIVIDAMNAHGVTAEYMAGRLSSDIVAEVLSGALVVKAFNYLPAYVLAEDPSFDGGRRVMFIAGNHDAPNAKVVALTERLGFAPILLGRIGEGGRLVHIPGPLVLHNLVEYPLNAEHLLNQMLTRYPRAQRSELVLAQVMSAARAIVGARD